MKRMGMQYPMMDQFDDHESSGSGTEDEPNNPPTDSTGSQETPPTNSDDQQTGINFTHPDLQGLTEDQIAERFRVSKATFLEQGRQLEQLRNQLKQNQPNNTPANPPMNTGSGNQGGIPDEDPYASFDSTKFFENPGAGFKTVEDRVVSKLSTHLEQMIKPFTANLHEGRKASIWNELYATYPDAKQYEDFIKTVASNMPDDQLSFNSLEYLYFAAKGRAASLGETPNNNNNNPTPPNAPPQHRPSSHPVNNSAPKPKPVLTEEDRSFMRAFGMSEEEYVAYQAADESDVLSVKVGEKNNNG